MGTTDLPVLSLPGPFLRVAHTPSSSLLQPSRKYRHTLGRLWEARLLSPALTSTFVGRVFAPRQATTFISRTRLSMRNVGGTYIPRIDSRLCFPDLQMRPSHAGHQIMAEARLYRPQVALATLCVPFRKEWCLVGFTRPSRTPTPGYPYTALTHPLDPHIDSFTF